VPEDFDSLFDWLADRAGQRVTIELGVDEGAEERPQLLFPLSIHATLGKPERKEGVGPGLTVYLRDVDDRDRLWIDRQRILRLKFMSPDVVRVWLDPAVCLQLVGDR